MSWTFEINGVQIFGNNEMFNKTWEELKRQIGSWIDEPEARFYQEISDPVSLLSAIEKDIRDYLLANFKTDKEMFVSENQKDYIIQSLYEKTMGAHTLLFHSLFFVREKYFLVPYNAYIAMQDAVRWNEERHGVLENVPGKTVKVSWG